MKAKGWIKLLITLLVIGFVGFVAIIGLGENKAGSASDIRLGLDLAGGVSITYEPVKDDPTAEEISDTRFKMEKRAQSFSTEAEVYLEGEDRITVAIPDVTDADEVLADLGDAGNIYFIYGMSSNGVRNIERYQDTSTGTYFYVLTRPLEEIIADGDVVIDGSSIAGADPNIYTDELNVSQNVVVLTLNEEGRERFTAATTYCYAFRNGTEEDDSYRNIIAIVYDNEVVSAPGVAAVIDDGVATISGQRSYEEASQLATTIRIGALPLELSVLRYYVEGAKLGSDALKTSLIAGAIGFAIIIIFMCAVYKIPGLAASLALMIYVGLMVISLNIFGVTLTLPGVAGIILSVGMAVDANVIIFTRIKEEITSGKTVRGSIKLGFSRALSAIIDGNVTTIIAALVLYYIGSGTVKGFAQTLGIGIVLSMITALFVTKFILNALFEIGFTKVRYYGMIKSRKTLKVVENFPKFICISGGVIAIGVIAVIINFAKIGTPFNYGLDFSGGTATKVTLSEELGDDIKSRMEKTVSDALGISCELATVADENMISIKTRELTPDERADLAAAICDEYGIESEMITTESVGSTVSSEMKSSAVLAVIIATLCMLIYIAVRFKNFNFALSAVLALLHDVLIVLVVYAVCRSFISVGNTFIACMLTIVGYSINATIVIFDRIRENRREMLSRDSLLDVVNVSVTQTLTRSIDTSLTTFFTVFVLAILGVSSVREFAIPLIAGIVCGAFSSVCITGGLWYRLNKIKDGKVDNQ